MTTKRAHFYAQAALKMATDMRYDGSLSLSVYLPEMADPAAPEAARSLLTKARQKLFDQHRLAMDLISAVYAIRQLRDEVDYRVGTRALLNRKAQLGMEEGRLRVMLKAVERIGNDEDETGERSLAVALNKAQALRSRSEERYLSRVDTVAVMVLDETDVAQLHRQLKVLLDERASVDEQMQAINHNHTIELDATTVNTLRRADLLPAL